MGPDGWKDHLPDAGSGLMVLGSPIGSPSFVQTWCEHKAHQENEALRSLACVPDPQCRWLLLKFCCEPKINHLLRNVPPADVLSLADKHDAILWTNLLALFDFHAPLEISARDIVSLPLRFGGLGLRSASRTRFAAYWAAWFLKPWIGFLSWVSIYCWN